MSTPSWTDLAAYAAEPAQAEDARIDGYPLPSDIRTREILGVPVALTDYEEVMEVMDGAIASRERVWVSAAPVHAVMVAQSDPDTRDALRRGITVPDGMPLVWAVRALGEELAHRVYGPELMWRYCVRSVERGHRVWLYGGRDQGSLAQLALNLRQAHPGINIVGGWSPPFRSLIPDEETWLAEPVAKDRPDVLWVGIGVSKQE